MQIINRKVVYLNLCGEVGLPPFWLHGYCKGTTFYSFCLKLFVPYFLMRREITRAKTRLLLHHDFCTGVGNALEGRADFAK